MTILDLINAARASRSLPALIPNARLDAAALEHAVDLARHPELTQGDSHRGSDGSTVWQRAQRAGYEGVTTKEVTGWAWGDWNEYSQMAYWQASPPHAAILYDGSLNEVGAAYLPDAPGPMWTRYWVVVFGRGTVAPDPPQPPQPPPLPYTSHVPIVVGAPTAPGIDLLDYLRGDGRAYRVGNARGSFEVFQTQTEGDTFYQVKAWDDLSRVNWESFVVTPEHIGRDVDTSPGGGRFYRQFGKPWVKRRMAVGESFTQTKRVQFYNLSDCSESAANSGDVTDTITLVEHLDTWRSPWGIVVPDVVVLRWEQGGELYRFGRDYGLVGWGRTHNDPNSPSWSAISELRPDVGTLARLRIGCL